MRFIALQSACHFAFAPPRLPLHSKV